MAALTPILSISRLPSWNFRRPAWLVVMTYQSDSNTNRRNNKIDDIFCTSWIVGGGVGIAIVIAVFAFISTGDNPDLSLPRANTAGAALVSSELAPLTPASR